MVFDWENGLSLYDMLYDNFFYHTLKWIEQGWESMRYPVCRVSGGATPEKSAVVKARRWRDEFKIR